MVKAIIEQVPYLVTLTVNDQKFYADEPTDKGGGNKGPGPKDMLLGSLGSCTCITVSMYAKRKGWPLERMEVVVTLTEEDKADGHYSNIERRINFFGPLDEEQRKRLLYIANRCPVHKILTGSIDIKTLLNG